MTPFQLNSCPPDADLEIGGPPKETHPPRPLGSAAKGYGHDSGQPCHSRAVAEGEGGREEEEAAEVARIGAWGGNR